MGFIEIVLKVLFLIYRERRECKIANLASSGVREVFKF